MPYLLCLLLTTPIAQQSGNLSHSKNKIVVLTNNLVTVVAYYPSHANLKNAILVHLMGHW